MSAASPQRRAGLLGLQLALVAVSVSLPLAAAELYLRATDPRVVASDGRGPPRFTRRTADGIRLLAGARVVIRNHSLSGRDVPVRINAHGFRGPEIPSQRAQGERRVLVLGDSITIADYLPEEEVWVGRLATRLAGMGHSLRVINAGVSDIGLEEELAILESQGLAVEPDLVILGFYLNDSRPPWGFTEELRHRGWLRRNSLLAARLYRALELRRFLGGRGEDRFQWVEASGQLDWSADRVAFAELVSLARYDWGAAWRPEAWETIDPLLERLAALSEERGFRVVVVAFPVSFQVFSEFVDDGPQRSMERRAHRLGFGFVDLLPTARAEREPGFFFDQCHPRERGNDIFAREIARFLDSWWLEAEAAPREAAKPRL